MLFNGYSGGGNSRSLSADNNGPPLRWMSYEATSAGLLMNPFQDTWNLTKFAAVKQSLKGFWRVFEFLPVRRLSYQDADSLTRRFVPPSSWLLDLADKPHFRPQLGGGRRIQPRQMVHSTVITRLTRDAVSYSPRAQVALHPKDNKKTWRILGDLFTQTQAGYLFKQKLETLHLSLEDDIYDEVCEVVTTCEHANRIHERVDEETSQGLLYVLSTRKLFSALSVPTY